MKSRWTKPTIDAFIHVSAWYLTWWAIFFVFDYSTSKYVYATISAWWCALYVGYIRSIGWKVLLPLSVIYVFYILIAFIFEIGLFSVRRNAPSFSWDTLDFFVPAVVAGYVFFASPVIVNCAVRYVVGRVRDNRGVWDE